LIEEETKDEHYTYEIHKEKFNLFKVKKNNWVKHDLHLKALGQYDLWEISMISEENEASGKRSEEIFLL